MRKLYAYKKENICPVQKFIDSLNGKIKAKFLFQLSYIMDEKNGFVEPYVKHFSMERYRQMYEIRVKAAERMMRIIFYESAYTEGELSINGNSALYQYQWFEMDGTPEESGMQHSMTLQKQ